jgi:hypothetical protein
MTPEAINGVLFVMKVLVAAVAIGFAVIVWADRHPDGWADRMLIAFGADNEEPGL